LPLLKGGRHRTPDVELARRVKVDSRTNALPRRGCHVTMERKIHAADIGASLHGYPSEVAAADPSVPTTTRRRSRPSIGDRWTTIVGTFERYTTNVLTPPRMSRPSVPYYPRP
jgi:hypothetical protein